jgi:hypothetical protein
VAAVVSVEQGLLVLGAQVAAQTEQKQETQPLVELPILVVAVVVVVT